jgi:predicted Zn-dependent peptidase
MAVPVPGRSAMLELSPRVRAALAAALLPSLALSLCLTPLAAGLAAAAPAAAPPAACVGRAAVQIEPRSFRLANGMTFLIVERPDPARVAAGWVVGVGSADDPTGATGASHLLEHMMFKGTRTIGVRDANELDALYGRAGATSLNAFTRNDLTAYFVSLPANEIELWFWLESDRLLAPVFRDLEGERKVIEQERQRDESTPRGRFQSQFNALFWRAQPYRAPILGWPSDLAAVAVAGAEHHFQAGYTPGNLTAVLVGHLDRQRIEDLAQRYFGRLPAAPAPHRTPTAEPEQLAETRMNAAVDGPAEIEIRYHSVPFRHPDSYALEVLAGLLNGPGGRLAAALLAAESADEAAAEQVSLRRAGFFAVTARARGDHGPEPLEQAWYEVLRRLQEEAVSPAELERVRDRIAADTFRRLREPLFLLVQLLTAAGLGDWHDLDEHACRVAAVSAEDVRRVARAYFQPRNRTVGLYRSARETGKP